MEGTKIAIAAGLALSLLTPNAWASCSKSMKNVSYAAKFNWGKNAKAPLRIRVGQDLAGRTWAEITTVSGACVAACDLKGIEGLAGDSPSAMRLACRAERFGALETPATLVLKNQYGRKPAGVEAKPIIRFGSWIKGYRDTSLDVDLDKLATTPVRRLAALRTR